MITYQFRFPADTPEMNYNTLAARLRAVCDRERCTSCTVRVGSTITVRWYDRARTTVQVQLYNTCIAIMDERTVRFPNDDPHMTTTAWIGKIVADNGLGGNVGRIRRRKADGPGPETSRGGQAGLLVIDFDHNAPVHGRVWPVDYGRLARMHEFAEQWAASMAFRQMDPGQWDADLAAAEPHSGGPDYRDRVPAEYWQGTTRQPSLTDIR